MESAPVRGGEFPSRRKSAVRATFCCYESESRTKDTRGSGRLVSLARGPCAWSVVTGGCSPLRGLRTSPARLSDRPAVGGAWLRPGKRRFWGRSFRLLHLISDAGVQVSVRRLLLGQAGTAGARQRPDTEGAPVSSTAVHLRLVSVSPPQRSRVSGPPPPIHVTQGHPGAQASVGSWPRPRSGG